MLCFGANMEPKPRSNLYLGIAFGVFAAFVAFVWIPLDTETGILEKVRSRTLIGDALAPTVAAFFVGVGGVLLLLFERKHPEQPAPTVTNLRSITIQLAILVFGFLIMLHAGPLAVTVFLEDAEYRLLRDSWPWKYIGYFLGGSVIVSGLISQAEGRISARNVLIGVCVTIGLIVIYDFPFEDLLLPPNGDV